MTVNQPTLIGTAGGTLLSVMANIGSSDVVKTIVLASIGATVSFIVSLLLKCLFKKHKK